MSRIMCFVLVALVLLLPTNVGAQEGTASTIYLPIAYGVGNNSGPSLIQFRSCGGYNGIPLQYKEVPVGELTALTEECTGGEAYPSPIAGDNEGVALGGYWWKDYNWHLVPHIGKFDGVDVQFHMNMGIGGAPPPYLSVDVRDGQLHVFKGQDVYTTTTTIEGWQVTFHLDGAKPYVLFTRDLNKIWVALDDARGILWIEVQTPQVELVSTMTMAQDEDTPQPPAWGTWYYVQCQGHLPSIEVMEELKYIINRYPINPN